MGPEQHVALRRQKTADSGARVGLLTEPAPRAWSVAPRCPDGGGLSLAQSSLADAQSEAVDAKALRNLLKRALVVEKEEEAEAQRMDQVNRNIAAGVPLAAGVSRQWALPGKEEKKVRRTRTKRRKRKLPRTPLVLPALGNLVFDLHAPAQCLRRWRSAGN